MDGKMENFVCNKFPIFSSLLSLSDCNSAIFDVKQTNKQNNEKNSL